MSIPHDTALRWRVGARVWKLKLDKVLASDVVEPAQTEWAVPIVSSPRKDGALCFLINNCKLISIMIRDSYLLPCVEKFIDSLGDDSALSGLHSNSSHWQAEIANENRGLTAFTSHHGLYRFTISPFGLKKVSSVIQQARDMINSVFEM